MSYVVYVIVALIIGAAIAYSAKPPQPPPAEFEDFQVPTAEQGRPIPVVFGTVTITSPTVVWYGNLRYRRVRTKSGK